MIFNVRLADDLAHQFDHWAKARGGRSAALRHLIQSAVGSAPLTPHAASRRPVRLTIRLSSTDQIRLNAAAADLGLSPSGWAAALIRRRLEEPIGWPRGVELKLLAAQADLGRMGRIVSALARAQAEGESKGGVAPGRFETLHLDLRRGLCDIAAAMRSGIAYWDVEL